MNQYEVVEVIGEGTYGVVMKCRHKTSKRIVAVKRFKHSDSNEYVRCTMLRELRVEQLLTGEPYVVQLIDSFKESGKLHLVMEYIQFNLLDVLDMQPTGLEFNSLRVLMFTLLLGIRSCHTNGIIHRDIKPENILVKQDGCATLCDFGFSRPITTMTADLSKRWSSVKRRYPTPTASTANTNASPLHTSTNSQISQTSPMLEGLVLSNHLNVMTDYVATRWYRSPEMLLGMTQYDFSVDLWAVGAIMAEAADGQPLLPGKTELEQLSLIQARIGPFPSEYQSLVKKRNGGVLRVQKASGSQGHNPLLGPPLSSCSTSGKKGSTSPDYLEERFVDKMGSAGVALLKELLASHAKDRPTVDEALAHPFFAGLAEKYCPSPRSPCTVTPTTIGYSAQPSFLLGDDDGCVGEDGRCGSDVVVDTTTTTTTSSLKGGSRKRMGNNDMTGDILDRRHSTGFVLVPCSSSDIDTGGDGARVDHGSPPEWLLSQSLPSSSHRRPPKAKKLSRESTTSPTSTPVVNSEESLMPPKSAGAAGSASPAVTTPSGSDKCSPDRGHKSAGYCSPLTAPDLSSNSPDTAGAVPASITTRPSSTRLAAVTTTDKFSSSTSAIVVAAGGGNGVTSPPHSRGATGPTHSSITRTSSTGTKRKGNNNSARNGNSNSSGAAHSVLMEVPSPLRPKRRVTASSRSGRSKSNTTGRNTPALLGPVADGQESSTNATARTDIRRQNATLLTAAAAAAGNPLGKRTAAPPLPPQSPQRKRLAVKDLPSVLPAHPADTSSMTGGTPSRQQQRPSTEHGRFSSSITALMQNVSALEPNKRRSEALHTAIGGISSSTGRLSAPVKRESSPQQQKQRQSVRSGSDSVATGTRNHNHNTSSSASNGGKKSPLAGRSGGGDSCGSPSGPPRRRSSLSEKPKLLKEIESLSCAAEPPTLVEVLNQSYSAANTVHHHSAPHSSAKSLQSESQPTDSTTQRHRKASLRLQLSKDGEGASNGNLQPMMPMERLDGIDRMKAAAAAAAAAAKATSVGSAETQQGVLTEKPPAPSTRNWVGGASLGGSGRPPLAAQEDIGIHGGGGGSGPTDRNTSSTVGAQVSARVPSPSRGPPLFFRAKPSGLTLSSTSSPPLLPGSGVGVYDSAISPNAGSASPPPRGGSTGSGSSGLLSGSGAGTLAAKAASLAVLSPNKLLSSRPAPNLRRISPAVPSAEQQLCNTAMSPQGSQAQGKQHVTQDHLSLPSLAGRFRSPVRSPEMTTVMSSSGEQHGSSAPPQQQQQQQQQQHSQRRLSSCPESSPTGCNSVLAQVLLVPHVFTDNVAADDVLTLSHSNSPPAADIATAHAPQQEHDDNVPIMIPSPLSPSEEKEVLSTTAEVTIASALRRTLPLQHQQQQESFFLPEEQPVVMEDLSQAEMQNPQPQTVNHEGPYSPARQASLGCYDPDKSLKAGSEHNPEVAVISMEDSSDEDAVFSLSLSPDVRAGHRQRKEQGTTGNVSGTGGGCGMADPPSNGSRASLAGVNLDSVYKFQQQHGSARKRGRLTLGAPGRNAR